MRAANAHWHGWHWGALVSVAVVFTACSLYGAEPLAVAPTPSAGDAEQGGAVRSATDAGTAAPVLDEGSASDRERSSRDGSDDSNACGNGKLDPEEGESCDPSSQADACVVSCDDGNPCTRDSLRGEPQRCNAQCRHRLLDGALAGIGCCVSGALVAVETCDADVTDQCGAECRQSFHESLVHRYSFSGSGTRVVDSVGDADGTLLGGALAGDGDLVLDGSPSQYVELPGGLISGLSSASIEIWLVWRARTTAVRIFDFGSRSDASGAAQATTFWALSARSFLNGNIITVMNFTQGVDADNDEYALGNSQLGLDTLQHVVTTFDGTARTLQLFVNAELQGSNAAMTGSLARIDDQQAWIGRALDDSYPALNAVLHEVRIYDQALDPSAILTSYSAGPDPIVGP
jgi:hypothetical protein